MRGPLAMIALLFGTSGCSYVIGASVLPTKDTDGEVGVEARLNFGTGITNAWPKNSGDVGRTAAVLLPAGSAGLRFASGETCVPLHGGAGFASLGPEAGDIGFNAGLLGVLTACPDRPSLRGAGLQLGAPFTLLRDDGWTHKYLTLGLLFEAAMLTPGGETNEVTGRFALGPSLQFYGLTQWALGM